MDEDQVVSHSCCFERISEDRKEPGGNETPKPHSRFQSKHKNLEVVSDTGYDEIWYLSTVSLKQHYIGDRDQKLTV